MVRLAGKPAQGSAVRRTYRGVIRGLLAVTLALILSVGSAHAEFPERTVTVIVPNEAGGPLDIIARIVVKNLQKLVPQKIVVQNIVGGGTAIGDRAARNAAPDGYTLLMIHQSFLIAAAEGTLGFDFHDMTPIARTGGQDPLYVASADAPFKTFPDFIAHARAHPNVDRVGVFLTAHNHAVALAVMQSAGVKLKLINIPGGGAPLIPGLLSNQIDVAMLGAADVEPYVKAGKMVPLAVFGDHRAAQFPDVPTAAELGYPQLDMNVTSYWWMRKDVPAQLRDWWTDKLEKVMQDPEAIAELRQETDDVRFARGAALQQEVDAEYDKFNKIVAETGLKRQ
jgi:tripartite-type tricarboxylate transporter receptor subunit TctC